MGKFLAGFAAASALWGLVFALHLSGAFSEEELELASDGALELDAGVVDDLESARPRRGRSSVGPSGATGVVPSGEATTGDDLGENDPRSLEMGAGGGEAQLSSRQVEQGMDAIFGRIRKCLMLAAGDEPATGTLVFGLRIEPDGTVSRVKLTGPAVATTGEAGQCLRAAAKQASFPSFDGPPMFTRYPITLE